MNSVRIARRVVPWLPAVGWMAVIFYLSAQPELPHHSEAQIDLVIKKVGHMVEYAILAALALWAARRGGSTTAKRAFLWALLIAVSYAVTDEIHQYFVPGRNPRALDVGFDVVGACVGLLVVSRVVRVAKEPPAR